MATMGDMARMGRDGGGMGADEDYGAPLEHLPDIRQPGGRPGMGMGGGSMRPGAGGGGAPGGDSGMGAILQMLMSMMGKPGGGGGSMLAGGMDGREAPQDLTHAGRDAPGGMSVRPGRFDALKRPGGGNANTGGLLEMLMGSGMAQPQMSGSGTAMARGQPGTGIEQPWTPPDPNAPPQMPQMGRPR